MFTRQEERAAKRMAVEIHILAVLVIGVAAQQEEVRSIAPQEPAVVWLMPAHAAEAPAVVPAPAKPAPAAKAAPKAPPKKEQPAPKAAPKQKAAPEPLKAPEPDIALADKLRKEREASEARQAKKAAEEQARAEQLAARKKEEQAEAQRQAEAEARQAAEAEAEAQRNERERVQLGQHIRAIQEKVRRHVNEPAGLTGRPQAEFDVVLQPGGDVVSATLVRSSGVPAYDEAIRIALREASPLPLPAEPRLASQLRRFRLEVRPR